MNKPNLIPEKIVILKQAKEEIREGSSTGLCSAISAAHLEIKYVDAMNYEAVFTAAKELGTYVRKAIENYKWLGGWQEDNGFGRRTDAQQRQDRMDWIDWMIKCYREDLQS